MQGAFVPEEVRSFLSEKGNEEYPPMRPSTLAGKILVDWALANGMKKKGVKDGNKRSLGQNKK